MELTKRDIEILLALVHQLTDDDDTPDLTSEEKKLVERLEAGLVIKNVGEAYGQRLAEYKRVKTTMTVHTNEVGHRCAWFHIDGTMELSGSFVPAHNDFLHNYEEYFSMTVWDGRKWVTARTLGSED